MPRFKGKEYKNLSESTKTRLASALEKVHKSGFTISDYEQMNDKDFASNLGIKLGKKTKYGYSNVYAHRKLFRQTKGSAERKQNSVDKAIKHYEKDGWPGKGLKRMRRELVKTAGATFFEVHDQVLKEHKELKTRQERYEYTRQLLKVPMSAIDDLEQKDQDIIEGYDTSP